MGAMPQSVEAFVGQLAQTCVRSRCNSNRSRVTDRLDRGARLAQYRRNAVAESLGSERAAEVGGATVRRRNGAVEGGLDGVGGANEMLVLAPLTEPGEQHGGG